MSGKRFAVACLLVSFALLLEGQCHAGELPNIVVLMADDLGYADVGFQGCPDIPTPHIDSLARDSVRFTSAYVAACYAAGFRLENPGSESGKACGGTTFAAGADCFG